MASVTSVRDPPRKQTTTSVSQMSSLLECPVCGNYALPPIMQCKNGHHLCAPCRKNVAMSPVCRAPKGNNRNLALDKLAESTLFPCKYRSKGCTTSLLIAEKKRHENFCERGPCCCVLDRKSCKWRGPLQRLVGHILGTHDFVPRLQGDNGVVTATNFRRVEAFCWVALQTCLGRDFVVMLWKMSNRASRNHFFGAVLLVGSSEEARRFLYRFELCGAEHRLSWSARTRNLHSQADIDRSGDGLVLDMSTAERLCNGADLIMDVTVSVASSSSGDNVLFACSGWVRTHPYPSNRKKVSVDDLVVQIAEKKTMEFIYEIVLDHATNTDPLLHNVVRMFQGCSDKSFLLRNPAMTLQAALDDVRLTDWPYDEEPLDLNVPEVIAFATRKMDVKPFFVPSLEIDPTAALGWCFCFNNPGW